MWTLDNLIIHAAHTQTEINGVWVPSKPIPPPFWWRARDAWRVLTGRASAFQWPIDETPKEVGK